MRWSIRTDATNPGSTVAQNTNDCFTLWHWDAVPGGAGPATAIAAPRDQVSDHNLGQVAAIGCPRHLQAAVDFLDTYADLREDRATGNPVRSSGHRSLSGVPIVNLHPDHKKWTLELLDAALSLANLVGDANQARVAVPAAHRVLAAGPADDIDARATAALPSGHSTEAHFDRARC